MKCQRCESDRVLETRGKTSDLFMATWKGKDYDGYVLRGVGLGDNEDYMDVPLCLECGQVQGKFPVGDPDLGSDSGHGTWEVAQ